MDATAVRTAELTRLRRGLPGAAFVVLTALAIPLTVHAGDYAHRASARDAALSAARQEVADLVNISYRTGQRDLGRIVAGATGQLAALFAAQHGQLEVLSRTQSVTTGSVLSAGLLRLDLVHGVARVDVAADGTLTDSAHQQPVVKHYRWVLTLQRRRGRWLVSDAALAGVPQ